MYYYLGSPIYKHQKYSLLFIFITNIILLFICSLIPKKDGGDIIFDIIGCWSILAYLAFIILSCASSFFKVLSTKNQSTIQGGAKHHRLFTKT